MLQDSIVHVPALSPGRLEGEEKKQPGTHCLHMHQVFPYSFRIHTYTSKLVLLRVQCTHLSFGSICESAPIAHYIIVYGAI